MRGMTAVLLIAVMAGCGGDSTGPEPITPVSVTWSVSANTGYYTTAAITGTAQDGSRISMGCLIYTESGERWQAYVSLSEVGRMFDRGPAPIVTELSPDDGLGSVGWSSDGTGTLAPFSIAIQNDRAMDFALRLIDAETLTVRDVLGSGDWRRDWDLRGLTAEVAAPFVETCID